MNLSHTRAFIEARIHADLRALKQHEAVRLALDHVVDRLGDTTAMGLVASNLRDAFMAQQDGDDDTAHEAAEWLINAACDVERDTRTG